MLDKPLIDPQPIMVIAGIIMILLGLLLSWPVRRLLGLGRFNRLNDVLDWVGVLLLVLGATAILRGSGLRHPLEP